MTRTVPTILATVLLLTTVLTFPAVAAPDRPIVWWSAGDSYSSGEGIEFVSGDCAQSGDAWGPKAAAQLVDQGWTFQPDLIFTACTGHLVDDLYVRNDGTGKGSLYEWAVEQGLPDGRSVDVLTLTFGGNDLEFANIVYDCLFYKEPADATSFLDLMTSPWDDCDVTEDELNDRIGSFARSGELVGDSDGSQGDGGVLFTRQGGRFVIDDGREGGTGATGTGSMADFYTHLARTHVVPGGRLVVAGYPRLFAPSDEWGVWQGRRCHGITRGDANMLGRVAQTLNSQLRNQAALANERLDDVQIVYIDTLDVFGGPEDARTGSHELCGNQAQWLNGLTATLPSLTERRLPSISPRPAGSFHPNSDGHAAIADAVVSKLADYQPARATRPVLTVDGTSVGPFPLASFDQWMEMISGGEMAATLRINADDVIAHVTERLEAPTSDSGWSMDDCGDAPYRKVAWGQFQIDFLRWPEAGDEHIAFWAFGVPAALDDDLAEVPGGLRIDSPVELGDPASSISSAFTDAYVESVHGDMKHYWTAPDEVGGLLSGPPDEPGAKVLALGVNYPWLGC